MYSSQKPLTDLCTDYIGQPDYFVFVQGRSFHAWLVDVEFGLKAFVLNLTHKTQLRLATTLVDIPCSNVSRAVQADVAGGTPICICCADNCKAWRPFWGRVPFLLGAAIALDQIVNAKPCTPSYICAGGTVRTVFFDDWNLAIVEKNVAVGEKLG